MPSTAATALEAEHARRPRKAASIGMVTYLGLVLPDYLTLIALGVLTLGLYWAPMYRPNSRLVAIWPSVWSESLPDAQGDLRVHNELAYPDMGEPLPSWACGLVVVLFPLIIIAIFQLKIQSLWDFHAGLIGLLKSLLLTSFVTTTLKHFIGGPRPNFFALCEPDWTAVLNGSAWIFPNQTHGYYYNTTLCQGEQLTKALQGFPSGHTSSAFAAATFLSLYMNAKLKTFADYGSEFWVVIITISPLIFASLIAGSQYTSYQHHAHEIFAGMLLGIILALLIYRSVYAAVFNFRYNHIPLPPFGASTQFTYRRNVPHLRTKRFDADGSEDDHLVVWDWWNQSEIRNRDQAKELSWLKSIQNVKATGQEMAPMLRGLRQRHKVTGKLKMEIQENDLERNRARNVALQKTDGDAITDLGSPGEEPNSNQREVVEIRVFELHREPARASEVQDEVVCHEMMRGIEDELPEERMEGIEVQEKESTSDGSRVRANWDLA